MKSTLEPSTFWQRLQKNGETNAAMLAAAGVRPELVGEVVCPVCSMQENALFWSCEERSAPFLHLRCPRCQKGSVWYSLKKNAPIESFLRLSRVLCSSAAAMLVVAVGLLASQHSDLLPPRLEARAIAAREAATQGRQDLDVGARFAVSWLGAAVSEGYQRALLLKETERLSSLEGRPVLSPRAQRLWHTVVSLASS